MAFSIGDFKKTTRSIDGERMLYPHQIRDGRFDAAIGYAIAYYERMVGRRQAEFERETLLEFFGDPRLARGLVACLGRSYSWREQRFDEVFGEQIARELWRAGLANPAALRTRLYTMAGQRYGGVILPHERSEALQQLCAELPLTPAQFERALTLDAEDQRILVKHGSTPSPAEIVARYNYHSLETALVHAELLRLQLRGPIWSMLRSAFNLARRYRLRYELNGPRPTLFSEQLELTLHGSRDALGNWSRGGRRLVRALLRLLAAHPDCLAGGAAVLQLQGRRCLLRLDERALSVLGVALREEPELSAPWEPAQIEEFARAWSRAYLSGKTGGWRIRRDPEPLTGAAVLVLPDFQLQRGRLQLPLCLPADQAAAEAVLRDLAQLKQPALVLLPAELALQLRRCPYPLLSYEQQASAAIPALIAQLERDYPRPVQPELSPWQRLEQQVSEEGFVSDQQAAELLGCRREELPGVVARWGGPGLRMLPGLGVCTPGALDELRRLLDAGQLARLVA